MKVAKWVLFGVVAGSVGAAIWAWVSLTTNREIGWIAWGIGGLVGLAVRLASHEEEGDGFLPGLVALIIAILAIVAGKYAAVHLSVEEGLRMEAFQRTFGIVDFIFFLLAVATAYKVASGNLQSG